MKKQIQFEITLFNFRDFHTRAGIKLYGGASSILCTLVVVPSGFLSSICFGMKYYLTRIALTGVPRSEETARLPRIAPEP